MQRIALTVFGAILGVSFAAEAPRAETRICTGAELAATVDQTAQALRSLNADSEKRYQAKLAALAKEKGWSQEQMRQRANASLDDPQLAPFNREIETLVGRLDGLSAVDGRDVPVPCERLQELQRVRDRLLTLMGQKSGYMLAALDAEPPQPQAALPPVKLVEPGLPSAPPPAASPPAAEKPQPSAASSGAAGKEPFSPSPPPPSRQAAAPAPSTPPAPAALPAAAPSAPAAPPANILPQQRKPPSAWSTDVTRHQTEPSGASPPQEEARVDLPPLQPRDDSYSIDEINDAGGGLFGAISSEFAAVINYAFQKFGRPNAYIVGNEGGAAFLAGLRYGEGALHTKNSEPRPIYWQGPSVGVDFGASGSRVMLLVYNFEDMESILGRISGVEGSAYVAGGFGLTVLTNGHVVVVPIRSGLGLRLGASLGYLKFTNKPRWNPF